MTARTPLLLLLGATTALSLTLSCGGGGDGAAPTPGPAITGFVAAPATLTTGASTTLTATFSFGGSTGTAVITPGNLAVTSGQGVTVAPVLTTTYVLTVTGTNGNMINMATAVRVNAASGSLALLAGAWFIPGSADGQGANARFNDPQGLAADAAGNLYLADCYNSTIRKITFDGTVTTLAGTAGAFGSADGTGAAARFSAPEAVAVDAAGNVYVADTGNSTLRKITPAGVVTTLAGLAQTPGRSDGTGTEARFSNPKGIAVTAAGTVFVADTSNHLIRQCTAAGVVTTLAGAAQSGSTDGTGSAAAFRNPRGLAVDASGNLYLADTDNCTLRKVTPAGVVTTLAGTAGTAGSTDGPGAEARFKQPHAVALDPAGNLWVADSGNTTIRKVTAAGVASTVVSQAGSNFGMVTGPLPGSLAYPAGLAIDPVTGSLALSDIHSLYRVTF